ncbi:MAG: hypothetical protein IT353_18640 [Gemmatimonadaceae bacterium]|nr:hypothetical protein [Gemmatimonadaceae bacterium]
MQHPYRQRRAAVRSGILALILVVADATTMQAQSSRTGDELGRAAWLGGCWEMSAGARVTSEQWMMPRGGMMVGMSRTVVRDTARTFEHLRIQWRDGRAAYVAQPAGQSETTFAATVLSDSLLVFNNPAHDFPQQISYRRVTADSIVARIEGPQGGQVRGINYPMRRVRCTGSP